MKKIFLSVLLVLAALTSAMADGLGTVILLVFLMWFPGAYSMKACFL